MIMIDTTLPGSALDDTWSFESCTHAPRCPHAASPAACRARVIVRHDEQGWYLLCNGVVLFDDGGAILPNGRALSPTTQAA